MHEMLPKSLKMTADTPSYIKADALMRACISGRADEFEHLLKIGAPLSNNCEGTALQLAILNRHYDLARALLQHGAPAREFGDLALRCAATRGSIDMVDTLVAHGADIHSNNDIVMILACEHGHRNLVQHLMNKYGIQIQECDNKMLKLMHGLVPS
jgi:ankyrin repeat protein